jgi:hypothetical protein
MTIRTDLLLKLARHLERGKLSKTKFDFNTYGTKYHPSCKTVGCAIGECPLIFEEWDWNDHLRPFIPKISNFSDESAVAFFNITMQQFKHLFWPNRQIPNSYGGKHLTERASKTAVAKNIREFVKKVKEHDNSIH